jgi:ATP-dependent DNA helicase PIF1
MTLESLIEWVEAHVGRLPAKGKGVAHVHRLYAVLQDVGAQWSFRTEWHSLAKKIAKLLKVDAPEKVSGGGTADRATRGQRRPPRKRELAKKPPRTPIEVNAQLQSAFDAVAAGRQIIFVTGGAGTGKSTFIRELRERFAERNSVVLAPTGVAALTAGGQTIHSFCRLPLRPVMPEDAQKADDPKLIEAIELLIIDEVSMVRADVLDGVDAFLRLNRRSDAAFGGVQIVLVGDLFQLPPVVTPRDEESIGDRYPSPYFFSAHALRGLKFFPVELEIVYRQRDASFAEMLASIRDGIGASEALARLNGHCVGRTLEGRYLTLMPTRQAAAAENEARLAELSAKPQAFAAQREGTFENASDDRLPAPQQLVLKRGAQVMFVRNDAERRWVNGTLGEVVSLERKSVRVRTDEGATYDVEPIEWQDVRYALEEKTRTIVEEVVGTYKQFPLMPAWAVTIHKAQGLTLDKVLVDLGRGAFAEGQVYVALSRCQTLEGLSLRRAVRTHEVRTSQAAVEFYARLRRRRR